MQKRRRRTEITVTEETIIQRGHLLGRRWCALCGASVATASLETAADLVGANPSELKLALLSGEVHSWNISGDSPLVCLKSALRWIDSNPPSIS